MNEIFANILLSISQGILEFLPISSSGHLFLIQKTLELPTNQSFELWLHGGSAVAIFLYFSRTYIRLFSAFCTGVFSKKTKNEDFFFALKILVITVTTGLGVLIFRNFFVNQTSLFLTSIGFFITALCIFFSQKKALKNTEKNISWLVVLFLGFIQIFGLFHGISRSGIVIFAALMLGIEARKSAEISFLISFPLILGGVLLELFTFKSFQPNPLDFLYFSITVAVSYLVIYSFLRFFRQFWLVCGIYCLFLSIGLYWFLN